MLHPPTLIAIDIGIGIACEPDCVWGVSVSVWVCVRSIWECVCACEYLCERGDDFVDAIAACYRKSKLISDYKDDCRCADFVCVESSVLSQQNRPPLKPPPPKIPIVRPRRAISMPLELPPRIGGFPPIKLHDDGISSIWLLVFFFLFFLEEMHTHLLVW